MTLLDDVLAILAPHECLGCGIQGTLLCERCKTRLITIPERCYRCRKLSPTAATCAACRRASHLRHVLVATVYAGLAKELVWKLKFAGARAASKQVAQQMVRLLGDQADYLVVPVPTATSRVRQRGYDQATLLAKEIARLSGARYVNCLARMNQAHQVGANRQQRLKQLAKAFRVTKPVMIRGARILLIDDVITTGATLEAAATSLRAAGAQQIDALAFAQP